MWHHYQIQYILYLMPFKSILLGLKLIFSKNINKLKLIYHELIKLKYLIGLFDNIKQLYQYNI